MTIGTKALAAHAMALICAGFASTASAMAGSGAVALSERSIDAAPVSVAFDGAGRAVASWQGLRGPSADEARSFHAVDATGATGAWRPPLSLAPTVVAHDLAVTGRSRAALVAWRQETVGRNRSRSLITITRGSTASLVFGAPRLLDSGPARPVTYEGPQPTLLSPRVAAAPHGGVVVAWQRSYPRERSGVWVASMRPDGRFGRARRLGPGGGEPVLAVAPDGSGLVAWRRGRLIQARLRSRGGRWGPIETAAATSALTGAQVESLTVAGAGRRFALGVLQTRRSLSGVVARASVQVRVPGAGWRSAVLGQFRFVPTGVTSYVTDHLRVLVVQTSDARLHAVWPALQAGRVRAMTARLVPETSSVGFTLPAALSAADTDVALDDAAVGPDGRFAVTWFDTANGAGTPNLAEVDGHGGVDTTTGLAEERALAGSRVAYDPRSGTPLVLWSEGIAGQGYRIVAWHAPPRAATTTTARTGRAGH